MQLFPLGNFFKFKTFFNIEIQSTKVYSGISILGGLLTEKGTAAHSSNQNWVKYRPQYLIMVLPFVDKKREELVKIMIKYLI